MEPATPAGQTIRRPHWWRRFRACHSFRLWCRTGRDIVTIRWRKKAMHGVPAPRNSIVSRSVDTITVGEGFVLRADLYLPKNVEGPFPCVLFRTPYGRQAENGQTVLAERGYAVLVQDTRGRFSSDGEFVPVQDEREDGAATVAWMRQQPWCNGKIGVTGASYIGFTAWACLDGAVVNAIVPLISQSSVKSAVFHPAGAFSYELMVLWFHLVWDILNDLNKFSSSWLNRLYSIGKILRAMYNSAPQRALSHLPIRDVDSILLGRKVDFLQEALATNADSSSTFWDDKDRLCNFEQPVPPCHILTGWYDFFLEGALQDFARAKAGGQPKVRLTVGPFSHWGMLGSMRLCYETMLSWFDECLRGMPQPEDRLERPVRLYVMGAGWQSYADYPPACRLESLWLSDDFQLCQVCPKSSFSHSYFYDPMQPTPARGGPSFNIFNMGARDQDLIERRPDVLVYTTGPQEAPLLIVGCLRVRLEVSWQAVSADFVGRLCHVDSDGVSTNICEGLVTSPAQALPGTVARLEVALGQTALLVQPGEKLRLHVCSGAHPRWIRNLGSGEPLKDAQTPMAGRMEVRGGELILPVCEHGVGLPDAEMRCSGSLKARL